MRVVRQLVVVAGGRALVSGLEAVDVRHLRWADGMRSAWVVYDEPVVLLMGIGDTRFDALSAA